jgi:pyruvate/2-oxoglutarate dehydrogenase complex dihydrolipoamide acyltransferase (E2) component
MAKVLLERDNVNDDFIVVTKLHKQNGDRVQQDELVLDVETSKTVREVRAPEAGILSLNLNEGDEVAITAVLFEISADGAAEAQKPALTVVAEDPVRERPPGLERPPSLERHLSRAAERLRAELGVPLSALPAGWVVSQDVSAAARAPQAVLSASVPNEPQAPFRSERKSMRKRTEAKNLGVSNCHGNTSSIGIRVAADEPRLVAAPYLFQDSITDLVVFESAKLLRRYPEMNAFHLDERTVGLYQDVNFGISFDQGRDLKVLALRHADEMSLARIQDGIASLLNLYESGAAVDDVILSSSTVTLSDLSRSPAEYMFPLLNLNQSLILGITRAPGHAFMIYGSFDHRVTEGLQVSRFLGELAQRLSSHFRAAKSPRELAAAMSCSICERKMSAEVGAGNRGLLRMTLADGSEGHLCRNCFDGW